MYLIVHSTWYSMVAFIVWYLIPLLQSDRVKWGLAYHLTHVDHLCDSLHQRHWVLDVPLV